MKRQLFLTIQRVIFICLLFGITPAFAQQITPKVLPLNKPKIINFRVLTDYQLSHPAKKHAKRFIEQGEDREHGSMFKPHYIPSNAPVFTAPIQERATGEISPSPRIVFNGIISNQTLIPPDINGAVGDNYILETTNQEFDIFTKNGAYNSAIDIPTFFAAQNGTDYYDPHVEYDLAHKRYIIISDGYFNSGLNPNPSAIFVAVSQTDDPTGNWYTYSFKGWVVNDSDFLDYPLVGYNNNWVVITGNDYLNSGAIQVNVWVLNRASLYNGTLGTVKEFSVTGYISITPTQTYDTTISEDYLVQDADGNQGNGNGYLQIGAVSGTLNNPNVSVGNTLGVAYPWNDNTTGIGATQSGSSQTIESGLDTKIENSVYRNGSIWLTHTVYLPAGNPTYSAADWWQIKPSPLSVVQFGRIADPNGIIDYYYPSISVDAKNDVLLGYCTSSPNIYASSEYSYRASSDPINTMETGYLFQQGQGVYTDVGGGRNRYGDFTFTTTDPVDSSFWTFQEFAAAPSSTWGTVVANVGAAPCNNKPSAGSILTSVDTLCSGDGTILTLTGYTSNLTGIHLVWQQSPNGTNDWTVATDGIGDTTASYSTAPLTGITYFRCIVSCLNSGLSDTTAPIEIVLPGVYSVSNDTVCLPGNYNLTANGSGSVNWYKTSSANSPFYTGNTLNTTISKDTTFYVNTTLTKHYGIGIYNDNYGQGGYFNYSYDDGLLFNAVSSFTLDSVFIYASSTGTVTVNLLNADNGATISTATITVTGNEVNNATAVPTNFTCVAGTNYNINAANSTVSELFRTSAAADYSYTVPGVLSITAPNNAATGHYYFFYDWRISTTCTSPRTAVNVAVGYLILTAKASPDTLCEGSSKEDSILLTVTGATTYQWTPINTTDSSVFVKPTTTTTYSVTGSNSAGCTGAAHVAAYVENCATGVSSIAADNNSSIAIYPNPTTGQFDITMNNFPDQVYFISLYNILGQKILEKQVAVNSSATVPMDVSALPAGLYLVRVTAGNDEWAQRIIKR